MHHLYLCTANTRKYHKLCKCPASTTRQLNGFWKRRVYVNAAASTAFDELNQRVPQRPAHSSSRLDARGFSTRAVWVVKWERQKPEREGEA